MHKSNIKKNQGFTLIELSVVLIVISLIVSGAVAGQSIINSAKIRSIISDYKKVSTAVNTFKLQYNALPGDFNKAVEYGIGNNDGIKDRKISPNRVESIYFWEQLSKSNLFPGNFTGAAGSPTLQIGVNIPKASYGNDVAMHVGYIQQDGPGLNGINSSRDDLFGEIDNFNFLTFALRTNDTVFSNPFLNVTDTQAIDTKMDDGLADAGIMYAANRANSNSNNARCVNNRVRNDGGASYDMDQEGENCRIIFNIGR